MLSELEQEVVDSCKVWGTNAKHTSILFELSNYEKTVNSGRFPEKSELEETFGLHSYRGYWSLFNIKYDITCPHYLAVSKVNPLKVEQEAWGALSPIIEQYLDQIDTYVINFPPSELNEITKSEFLGYLSRGKELLSDWQIVCKSYAAKYQRDTEKIQETEAAAKDLIKRLTLKK